MCIYYQIHLTTTLVFLLLEYFFGKMTKSHTYVAAMWCLLDATSCICYDEIRNNFTWIT